MPILSFPPIETADEQGLLALGGDLDISSLKLAYKSGIFPWPISKEYPLAWFSPDPRGILESSDLYINKSLNKIIKKDLFTIKVNQNFSAIILECAKVKRSNQHDTWITEDIYQSYLNLFFNELAYSIECYFEEKLVGGIYGICIDGIISGESMFFKKDNASKICLVYLMKILEKANIGWLDTQMVTPIVGKMGGKSIPRADFIDRLNKRKRISRDQIFKNSPHSLLQLL